MNETTEIRLFGWSKDWAGAKDSVPQCVFGQLALLAKDQLEFYVSDLWHDVHWLAKHLEGPMEFFYGFDHWGTAIGTDQDCVLPWRENVYRVRLTVDAGGVWWLNLQRIK